MLRTLYNVALLQDSKHLIDSGGAVCLKDLRDYGIKEKHTADDLYDLRKQGYLYVDKEDTPRGMTRHYYRLTTKGKKKLGLKLSFWESLFGF